MALADVRLRFPSGKECADGHLAYLNWEGNGRDLAATVSLFSWFDWRVILARGFRGVWWDLQACHFWDIGKRRVVSVPARAVRVHPGPHPQRPRPE